MPSPGLSPYREPPQSILLILSECENRYQLLAMITVALCKLTIV